MSLARQPGLYVAHSPERGRGVYTADAIPAGSTVEICPVIVCPPEDLDHLHATHLHDYYFLWENPGETAIALGYGSLYNHAEGSNADYEMDYPGRTLTVRAVTDIGAGEEVTIDYTDGVDRSTLWF